MFLLDLLFSSFGQQSDTDGQPKSTNLRKWVAQKGKKAAENSSRPAPV